VSNFKVITDGTGTYDSYPDGSRYFFSAHGPLVAVQPGGHRTTYSAAGWLRIEDTVPVRHGVPQLDAAPIDTDNADPGGLAAANRGLAAASTRDNNGSAPG
jgi:hypothetical protein